MENYSKVVKNGTSLSTYLTVAFVVLKLCGVINWSWFWVLSPWIFTTGLLLGIIIVLVIILAVLGLINE